MNILFEKKIVSSLCVVSIFDWIFLKNFFYILIFAFFSYLSDLSANPSIYFFSHVDNAENVDGEKYLNFLMGYVYDPSFEEKANVQKVVENLMPKDKKFVKISYNAPHPESFDGNKRINYDFIVLNVINPDGLVWDDVCNGRIQLDVTVIVNHIGRKIQGSVFASDIQTKKYDGKIWLGAHVGLSDCKSPNVTQELFHVIDFSSILQQASFKKDVVAKAKETLRGAKLEAEKEGISPLKPDDLPKANTVEESAGTKKADPKTSHLNDDKHKNYATKAFIGTAALAFGCVVGTAKGRSALKSVLKKPSKGKKRFGIH